MKGQEKYLILRLSTPIKLLAIILVLCLAYPNISLAARKGKKWYDPQSPFYQGNQLKNNWFKQYAPGNFSNNKLGINFKNNNFTPVQAYKWNQLAVPKAGENIQPVKPEFTQMPKMNFTFTRQPSLSAIKPVSPAFTQMPKAGTSFVKLPSSNAIKPAFVQMPKISSNFTKLPGVSAIKPLKPAFTQMPKASASFVKLPSSNVIKPIKPALTQLPKVNNVYTQLPKLNSTFTKLPATKLASNPLPKLNANFAQLPKINLSFNKLPSLNKIQPAFTQLPKASSNFTQLPKLNANFAKLPGIKPAFNSMPKLNSGFTQLPKINSNFTKLPKVNSAFTPLPKINSNFTKLPSLNTTRAIKPAFTQVSKVNSNFAKLPALGPELNQMPTLKPVFAPLPKLNSGLVVKPVKPAFAKAEPFKNTSSPFVKSLNPNLKFRQLSLPHVPKFTPYTFSIAKIAPQQIPNVKITKQEFKFVELPALEMPKVNFTHLPSPGKVDVTTFNPANLMAEATISNSLEPELLVQEHKVKTLALLPIVPSQELAPEVFAEAKPQHAQALKEYLKLMAIRAEASEGLKAIAFSQQNPRAMMEELLLRESLQITQNYVNPAEKFLQSYLEMGLRE